MTPLIGKLYRTDQKIFFRTTRTQSPSRDGIVVIPIGTVCLLTQISPGTDEENRYNGDKVEWFQVLSGTNLAWCCFWSETAQRVRLFGSGVMKYDTGKPKTFDYFFSEVTNPGDESSAGIPA